MLCRFASYPPPNWLKDRTFRVLFRFPIPERKHKSKKPRASKLYRNTVILAKEWHKAIEKRDFSSQADLSRKLGISRARVTQVLNLLKLDNKVLEKIISLGNPSTSHIVTERVLRPIVNLPAKEQRQRIETILMGRTRDTI